MRAEDLLRSPSLPDRLLLAVREFGRQVRAGRLLSLGAFGRKGGVYEYGARQHW